MSAQFWLTVAGSLGGSCFLGWIIGNFIHTMNPDEVEE